MARVVLGGARLFKIEHFEAGAGAGGPGDAQVCLCEIDGRELGGMQIGDSCAGAVWGAG